MRNAKSSHAKKEIFWIPIQTSDLEILEIEYTVKDTSLWVYLNL